MFAELFKIDAHSSEYDYVNHYFKVIESVLALNNLISGKCSIYEKF